MLKRKTQLQADPAKAREWKRRSALKSTLAQNGRTRSPGSRTPNRSNRVRDGAQAAMRLKRGRVKAKPLTLAKRADIKFSLMIRESAGWRCARCGRDHSGNHAGLDLSHYFRRNKYAVRYDPRNADPLCHFPCHLGQPDGFEFQKQRGQSYYGFMVKKLGSSDFLALQILSESRCKLRESVEAFMKTR